MLIKGLKDLMRAVASSSSPGAESWDLMFHVEHSKGTVNLFLWWEPTCE